MIRPIFVGTFASLIFVAALNAECSFMSAKQALSEPGIELVFAGRVIDVQYVGLVGFRATFEVQEVWKGSVPARIDVYYERFAVEGPNYTKGYSAIVRAERLRDPVRRKRFGLSQSTSPTEYWALGCMIEPDFLRNLGPGHPPKG